MKLSSRGADLIKAFESCQERVADGFRAYDCPAGVLTIGWGHTDSTKKSFKRGDVWTQKRCDDVFAADMVAYEQAVEAMVAVPLKQHQFDALVSFAYNVGIGALKGSTLLRKLNRGDAAGAALEFHKWNRGGGQVLKGLVRRRASEALLFQGIDDLDFDGKPDPMARKVAMSGGRASAAVSATV